MTAMASIVDRLRARKEWQFFAALPRADSALALTWYAVLVLRGVLPAGFALSMGLLVAAVQRGGGLAGPLTVTGIIFILLQVLTPLHQALSANLGDRASAYLFDTIATACVAPPGMGHLEDPALTSDLTLARDFDMGMTGPPLYISMDFIASGMVEMIGGLASACVLFAFAWWARLAMGRMWSGGIMRTEQHRVIQSGPFAWVRHPIYTSLIFAGVALAVIRATPVALGGAALFALGFYLKARVEERFLDQELGGYPEYRARVPMLLPFLRV